MSDSIELFDVVTILSDIPSAGIKAGTEGTVLEIMANGLYEVEFSDESGKTLQWNYFHPNDLQRTLSDRNRETQERAAVALA